MRRLLTDEQRAMVEANLGLVHDVLRRKGLAGTDAYNDRVQDGIVGLIHAVETYDVDRGFKFSTHADIRIWHEIWKAISNDKDPATSLDAIVAGDDAGAQGELADVAAQYAFDEAVEHEDAAQDVARLGVTAADLALYDDVPDATIGRRLGISAGAVAARRYRLESRLRGAAGITDTALNDRTA
ncbi:MAG: polymerase primary sigma factor [Acidimicrobiaceae bacterium]|jgi:hypothetical protein